MNAPEGADDNNALNNSRGVSELVSNNAPPTMSLNVANANLKGNNKKRKGLNVLNDDGEEDNTNKLRRKRASNNRNSTRPSYKLHKLPFVSICINITFINSISFIHHTHTLFSISIHQSQKGIYDSDDENDYDFGYNGGDAAGVKSSLSIPSSTNNSDNELSIPSDSNSASSYALSPNNKPPHDAANLALPAADGDLFNYDPFGMWNEYEASLLDSDQKEKGDGMLIYSLFDV